jgi:hypothetical protein
MFTSEEGKKRKRETKKTKKKCTDRRIGGQKGRREEVK